jgi:hypothetical protein
MITDNRQDYSACSGSKLAKITGLELCAELSFPNASMIENAPYFPLTGPIRAGFTLYKRDNKMTGYILQARSTHVSNLFAILLVCKWRTVVYGIKIETKRFSLHVNVH